MLKFFGFTPPCDFWWKDFLDDIFRIIINKEGM